MNDAVEKGTAGSSFEDFLKEEGTFSETTQHAVKRVIAFQLAAAMERQNLSKKEMAERMSSSRSQLDRVLDPANGGVTLDTLTKAAQALGHTLRVELS